VIILKFSVSQIRKNAYHEPYTFEGVVDVSELETLNNDIRKTYPVNIKGDCTIQGDEIVFNFTIQGELILPCARTLVDVHYPYTIHAVEVFSTSPYYGKEEEENDIHEVTGEFIDLSPYVQENIVLELPYRVYSEDEEVLNQAITEGEGWELTSEDEQAIRVKNTNEDKIDPRLKKLQTFLDEKDED